MPQSKIDKWLLEQAGKAPDPVNSDASGSPGTMLYYTTAVGKSMIGYAQFAGALAHVTRHIVGNMYRVHVVPSGTNPKDEEHPLNGEFENSYEVRVGGKNDMSVRIGWVSSYWMPDGSILYTAKEKT